MKITSEITTNMTTVIASVSSRATATRPARTDMSSHTAPGSRMFTLKSSGNLLILYYYIRSGIGKLHVDKADGIFLFLVDDFGVYLGGLHIRMAK